MKMHLDKNAVEEGKLDDIIIDSYFVYEEHFR